MYNRITVELISVGFCLHRVTAGSITKHDNVTFAQPPTCRPRFLRFEQAAARFLVLHLLPMARHVPFYHFNFPVLLML